MGLFGKSKDSKERETLKAGRWSADESSARKSRFTDLSSESSTPKRKPSGIAEEEERPTDEEIDRRIGQMLAEQGQKPAVVQQIMLLDANKKWMMLQGYKSQAKQDEHPDDWVTVIHVEPTPANIETLSVLLTSYPVPWVEEFVLSGGVSALCDLLELFGHKPRKSDADLELLTWLLRCVRSLMNVELGMEVMIGGDTACKLAAQTAEKHGLPPPTAADANLNRLGLCIDAGNRDSTEACHVQAQALLLLAAAASYSSEAHGYVLGAFEYVQSTRRLGHRLSALVDSCGTASADAVNQAAPGHRAVGDVLNAQSAVIAGSFALLNAIVSSPAEISLRVELRSELSKAGFEDVLRYGESAPRSAKSARAYRSGLTRAYRSGL